MKSKIWKLKHMSKSNNTQMSSIKKHMDILVVIGAIVGAILTINASISELRKEIREDFARMDAKFDAKIDKLDEKIDARFAESDKRWYELLNQFHNHDKDIERLKEKVG